MSGVYWPSPDTKYQPLPVRGGGDLALISQGEYVKKLDSYNRLHVSGLVLSRHRSSL